MIMFLEKNEKTGIPMANPLKSNTFQKVGIIFASKIVESINTLYELFFKEVFIYGITI